MRVQFSIVLISAMFSISCFSQEKTDLQNLQQVRPAIVSAVLKPSGNIGLMIFDTYIQTVTFKNLTKKDTTITKEVAINKPSLLGYNNILMMPDAPMLRSYPLLLIPGDTLVLKEGIDGAIGIAHSSGYQNFIDSLIMVPKSFHWMESEQPKLLKTIGIKGIVQRIEDKFIENELKIRNLKLSGPRADILSKVNRNIKYTSIAQLLLDPTVKISSLTDSLYNDMYGHTVDFLSFDMINKPVIYGAIITYNAKKRNQNLNKEGIWAYVAGADEQMKHTVLYKEYVTTLIANTFVNSPEDFSSINKELQQIKTQAPALDTLYQLSDILMETFTNFKQAREKLKTFADGYYSFIIENDESAANHEKKSISNLPMVALYDFGGKQYDFKQIVTNDKYKFTIVDFWASWCIPCIGEMPALRKIEDKLKGKPVQFITISIDEDDQSDKWIEVAKREKIFTKPLQYRMGDFKKSALTKLINLKTIPRYLIIDNKGNILNEDFYRPSDPHFQLALNRYLN